MLIRRRARIIRKMMKRIAGAMLSRSLAIIVKKRSGAGAGAEVIPVPVQGQGQIALLRPKAGRRKRVGASLLLRRRAQSVKRRQPAQTLPRTLCARPNGPDANARVALSSVGSQNRARIQGGERSAGPRSPAPASILPAP